MLAPASRRTAFACAVLVFVVGFLLAFMPALAWRRATAPVADASATTAAPPPAIVAAAPEPILPPPREAAAAPAVDEPTFEARIDELVRIGRRTADLAQQDDIDAARTSDQEARARFAELLERFADAGERALTMLTTLAEPASDPATNGRRVVLELVIRSECERRDHDAELAQDRKRIDAFTGAILAVMPGTTITAAVGEATLVKQPFLRAVHEPAVLGLVRLADEDQFARPIATRLVLTLWDNMQRFGERSADELSRAALLLLGHGDASQRAAACRQLLKDARYRNMVIAWLREKGDRSVAQEIATVAANELPPKEALATLREIAPILSRMTNAYLLLGFRAADEVADSYRELLATNTDATTRADLVAGVGMTNTALGRDIAELAIDHDPSPDVRVQAVFALTSRGDAALAERAFDRALDDATIAADPHRLAALVLALDNLAATRDVNAIDRVAQRLRATPLLADSRQRLEAAVQRSLPGGQTSVPAPGGGR